MAKLNRETLKEIVKECLVELLAEGLTGGNTKSLTENINDSSTYSTSVRRKNIDRMLPPKNNKKINENFEENLNMTISKATKDPVLASILADTAKTTLQEQNSADQPNKFVSAQGHDQASRIVEQNNPEDIFGGEAASNWAKLAFADN